MCLPATAPGAGGSRACRSCAVQRRSVEFEEAWPYTSDVDQVTDAAERSLGLKPVQHFHLQITCLDHTLSGNYCMEACNISCSLLKLLFSIVFVTFSNKSKSSKYS